MPEQTNLQLKKSAKIESGLVNLASNLCRKFNDFASHRSDKEDEWVKAIRQYDGQWDEDDREKIEKVLQEKNALSAPNINITRPKTDTAIAKLTDIQFPTGGDYNFRLRPTPVPEGIREALEINEPTPEMQAQAQMMGGDPAQVPSPAAMAQQAIKEYYDAAQGMTRQIKDQFVQTNYGTKARMAIRDFCTLGTAVLKGPYVKENKKTRYGEGLFPVVETGITPAANRVDPRLFYPNPSCRLPEELKESFEVHLMDKEELAALAKSPAYMADQIKMAIELGGNENDIPPIVQMTSFYKTGLDYKSKYVVHEYHGHIPKEILLELGEITEEEANDPLQDFYGEVWFCDRTVIRISRPILDGPFRSKYKVATYKPDPNSLFGHGVPYLIRHVQRILNTSYLMLMDNAGLTSLPQIVLNREVIEPAARDGDYSMYPGKVWTMTEYGIDVREAMNFVNIPANSQGLTQIIEMCLMFADMESMLPNHQQGEPVKANNMAGIAQVLTAMSIIQKDASQCWDDNITEPLVEDFYHYNMQDPDVDDRIKGDMEVEIGGATARIDSQMRGQDIERILGLSQMSEEFSVQINPVKAFRELVANSKAGDILRTTSEVRQELTRMQQERQQQAEQPDPQMLKAQADLMNAQANMENIKLQQQKMQFDQQIAQAKLQAEMQVRQLEVEARNTATLANLQQSQDARELELIKLASQREMTVEELATKLNIAVISNETARAKIEADITKQMREINVKEEHGSGL